MAKKIIYATPERIEQINPKNIDLWRKYLNGKRTLSERTREGYENDMMLFFTFILLNYDNQYLFDFDTEDAADMIEDYIAISASFFGNKDKRLSRKLSAISSMYIYYKKKRKIKENPIDLLERPKIQKGKYEIKQTFLTQEQVNLIRETLNDGNDTQLNLLFNFGLSTMARINAVNNVKISQIDLEKKRVERVIEKEGYEVTLLFDNITKSLIEKWLKEREEKGIKCEYLFISKYGQQWKKVDKSTIQTSWIKKIGAIIDEPEFHFHDLRHSGSSLLFKMGLSLEKVSRRLHHKSTQVTRDHYLQEDFDDLQEEMEKFQI